ncbi:hypothetical protein C8R43DRAFT_1133565 [Mycena crocata]|nr:hypothetical protein C8R43DRAFT_1133565 [Mycena crocata]
MSAATLDPGASLHNTCVLPTPSSPRGLKWVQNGFDATRSHRQCGVVWDQPTPVPFYFTQAAGYHRDPTYLKTLVATTVFLDTIHLAFVSHTVYHYLISNYYHHDALKVMIWYVLNHMHLTPSERPPRSVSLEALPTGVTAALVQSFYAYRVWRMSHYNYFLTGLILVLVLATSASGTAWVVLALEAETYERLLAISPLTISINALSTAADVIITSTLCFMLHQTQPASLETESMVNRLILFTINTGLLTSLCAIASLISLIISPKTLIYASFYFCIGRRASHLLPIFISICLQPTAVIHGPPVYSNALLASLNARAVIRGQINDVDTNFHIKSKFNPTLPSRSRARISREVFARPPGSVNSTELAIHIARDTALYAEEQYGNLKYRDDRHKPGCHHDDSKPKSANTSTTAPEE